MVGGGLEAVAVAVLESLFGSGSGVEELTVAVPYDEKSDIELFAIPPKYLKLNMSPGKFAIY